MMFSEDEMKRYDRNIRVEWIGKDGQEKMKSSKVLVIGAGGLGSPNLFYLAAAGIGTIGICEFDVIDESNLNRQILHDFKDVGKSKADSAKNKVSALNPDINVITHEEKLSEQNAQSMVNDYDFIIDATDNFEAKFLINDICVEMGKAFSHAGALGSGGQIMTHVPGSACLRCLIDKKPDKYPTSIDEGILGSVAGTLGTMQATEAIKFIVGKGELLTDRVLSYDALNMQFRSVTIKQRKGCICSKD